jgi:preprotein translocase subunit SecA
MAGRGTDILLGGNPKFKATDLLQRGEVRRDGLDPGEYERVLAEVRDMQRYGLLETDDPESYATALDKVRKEIEAEHQKVVERGGLHILATERHEAAASTTNFAAVPGGPALPIPSLPRGRPPPPVRSGRIAKIMEKLGMEERPIEHPASPGRSRQPRSG